jgi:imidazolonepropionase-like amidohydrolase
MLPSFDDVGGTVERAATRAMSPTGSLYGDFESARVMRDQGVRMLLSSDAGVRFTPFRRFDQSVECGMVALGITASAAIGLATLGAAEGLGISDQVGSIDVGKRADLIVMDGLLDDHSTRLGAVRQVWQSGNLVVSDGNLVIEDIIGDYESTSTKIGH